ncbi:ADAMTS-like protein 4 [Copidosoma floridanum]|uniref:ADAMTS-like protein 4 n=1 Tax=Copidosoma floridanum TaxID=29053 RepID=UPI0006C9AE69|nr:ADAMTS-like protein 4 [Copidosoma floridanum]
MINKICVSQQLCGQWFVGPWTKCSSSCDMGMETREVACVSKFLGVLKVVQPSNCQGNPPEQTRGCMGPPCNATWFMSDWTRCSRNCGRGYQKRKVQCIGPDGIPMNASVLECDEEKRPPSRRHCNDFSCNKNKSKDADSENDVEKECRDVLLDCWKIRSGSQEAKHKCEMEVFKKGCCKACRYSFLRSNGRSKIR